MSENERIKEIRKTLKMTMERFGERLGVTKTAISNIEKSKRNVTEQMRKAICREFNINGDWLRTGNGEMFVQLSQEDETAHIVQDMLGSNTGSFYNIILEIAKSYKKLSPTSQKALDELADNLLSSLANEERFMTIEDYKNECPKTLEELESLYPPVEKKPKVI
ncbi:helix-turn-helix transcriptional regulator [Enterocloster citroniae]|uniref:helix-turn-helix domain-containing protein n=1 Tax=Enterocloster citroniae TaxID=358743 RepID=UPI002E77812A|nr:helix-turn-helix transcriptional regulator [Enterocloster citroniae]